MLHQTLINEEFTIFFSEDCEPYTEKSSNHRCLIHLRNLYFECPESFPLPWEDDFLKEFYRYYYEKSLNSKSHHPINQGLLDGLQIGVSLFRDSPHMALAMGLQQYFAASGGTTHNWRGPKYINSDDVLRRRIIRYVDRARFRTLCIKPKTLHRTLYNFYEILFPGEGGKYASKFNYIEQKRLNSRYESELNELIRRIRTSF